MPPAQTTQFPRTTLIVGTDAAGKDHIANILETMVSETGQPCQKRKRYLCGKKTREHTSTAKNYLELLLEKGFILLYPLFNVIMPFAMTAILKKDIRSFAGPEKTLIVVGHNCLRGLAFYWGHRYRDSGDIPLSPTLRQTLAEMRAIQGLKIIVLDVDDQIRQKRIKRRQLAGEADFFDLYMAEDSERSERIERFLVWLGLNHLGATLIVNNDLSEEEIREELLAAFARQGKSQKGNTEI